MEKDREEGGDTGREARVPKYKCYLADIFTHIEYKLNM